MGNRASSNAIVDGTPQDTLDQNQQQEVETDASGVFLHRNLLGQVAKDFQEQVISQEWQERQKRILSMGEERVQKEDQVKANLHAEWESFQQQNRLRQMQLDSSIDTLQNRFSEAESITRHTVSKMEDEMKGGNQLRPNLSEDNVCGNVQVNLIECLKAGKVSQCDTLTESLERCMKKWIVDKQ